MLGKNGRFLALVALFLIAIVASVPTWASADIDDEASCAHGPSSTSTAALPAEADQCQLGDDDSPFPAGGSAGDETSPEYRSVLILLPGPDETVVSVVVVPTSATPLITYP